MVSYKKLQKLLIDHDMKKKDFIKLVNISVGTMARFGSNRYVTMDVIDRICRLFNCQPGDIMEHIDEPSLIPPKKSHPKNKKDDEVIVM